MFYILHLYSVKFKYWNERFRLNILIKYLLKHIIIIFSTQCQIIKCAWHNNFFGERLNLNIREINKEKKFLFKTCITIQITIIVCMHLFIEVSYRTVSYSILFSHKICMCIECCNAKSQEVTDWKKDRALRGIIFRYGVISSRDS